MFISLSNRLSVNVVRQAEGRFEDDLFEKGMSSLINCDMFTDEIPSISDLRNSFSIRCRLLHSNDIPDGLSKGFYDECKPAQTIEFIDSKINH